MTNFNEIFYSYSHSLNFVPEGMRVFVALLIIAILLLLIFIFIKRNIIYLIIFILLLPIAWPAIYVINTALWQNLITPMLK